MKFETLIKESPCHLGAERSVDITSLLAPGRQNFARLVASATSCSPFMRTIAESQPEWVASLAELAPDAAFASLVPTGSPSSPDSMVRQLRRAKRRMSFLVALADLGGVWPLAKVMQSITEFADHAVQKCLESLVLQAASRGRLILADNCRDEDLGGLFVLAMGKMGAFELNYSSDIDLILLYDDRKYPERDQLSIRNEFVRITRRFVSLMSAYSEDGYVFRTDLRLRPDPLVTPVCMPMGAAERYYENFGRAWERAAFIKARPCAGDRAAAAEFLESLSPFVWRKNLDFASVEDARNMREMIKEQAEHDPGGGSAGINVKLARGGIRDIEMMTQTIQIIAGGRDPQLRQNGTLDGLASLQATGWITGDVWKRLETGYVKLRRIEHRLQMINDTQTHSIPRSLDDLERAAALCGKSTPEKFLSDVRQLLADVDTITGEFFAPDPGELAEPVADAAGFVSADSIARWHRMPALRNDRAIEIFSRIQPKIMAGLSRSHNPGQAVTQFEGFLGGLPAGVQLFSLFDSNPNLIDLLTDICGTAPELANYLSRNAAVFDAVLDGDFFDVLPEAESLTSGLQTHASLTSDFEELLDICRRWMKERHFQVGVQHLRGIIDWRKSAEGYANVAKAVLACLWPVVTEQFSRRHGHPPGNGAVVIGLGSLGSGLLTSRSSLDLVVIYDCSDDEVSTGPKPLDARKYYAGLTRSLVSALSSHAAEGQLYAVDMRQRPTGTRGPVATSLDAFRDYQDRKARVWEHMALTQSRVMAGSPGTAIAFRKLRDDVIRKPRYPEEIVGALGAIRDELARTTPSRRNDDPWEARLGKGRILDITLAGQACALVAGEFSSSVADQTDAGVRCGLITEEEASVLEHSYNRLRQLLQVVRLTVSHGFNPDSAGDGVIAILLRETGMVDMGRLEARLARDREDCGRVIETLIDRVAVAGNPR